MATEELRRRIHRFEGRIIAMFEILRKLLAKQSLKIAVYVPDRAWGYGHPLTYERDSKQFRSELRKQHKRKFTLDNIGPGADWPAYVTWISIPGAFAAVLYLFFKGKEIKENLDAWKVIFQELKPFLVQHSAILNRDGAVLVVTDKISEIVGQDFSNIRLLGYEYIHMGDDLDRYDFDSLRTISEAPQPLYLGVLFHAFHVEVDGRRFGLLIYRDDIRVRELTTVPAPH